MTLLPTPKAILLDAKWATLIGPRDRADQNCDIRLGVGCNAAWVSVSAPRRKVSAKQRCDRRSPLRDLQLKRAAASRCRAFPNRVIK
jgi:hypothetical protein